MGNCLISDLPESAHSLSKSLKQKRASLPPKRTCRLAASSWALRAYTTFLPSYRALSAKAGRLSHSSSIRSDASRGLRGWQRSVVWVRRYDQPEGKHAAGVPQTPVLSNRTPYKLDTITHVVAAHWYLLCSCQRTYCFKIYWQGLMLHHGLS